MIITKQVAVNSRSSREKTLFLGGIFSWEGRKPLKPRSIVLDGPPSHRRDISPDFAKEPFSPREPRSTAPDKLLGRALLDMADAKVSLGDWPSATKLWDEALRLQKMTGNLNDIAVAETLSRRGRHLFKVRRYCESVKDLEKAVRIRTEELRHHQSNNSYLELSDTLIDLGRAQYMLENYVNSIQSLQTALARRIQVLGESDPRVADVFYEIATAYHRRKRYEEAQKSYRMAVLICREAGLRENHPTITRVLHRLADRNIIVEKFWQIASKI